MVGTIDFRNRVACPGLVSVLSSPFHFLPPSLPPPSDPRSIVRALVQGKIDAGKGRDWRNKFLRENCENRAKRFQKISILILVANYCQRKIGKNLFLSFEFLKLVI